MRPSLTRAVRVLAVIVASCLGLAVCYWALAAVFLSVPVGNGLAVGEAILSRHPERFTISWQSARSVLPGRVAVRGLTISAQSRRNQWFLRVGEGRGSVQILALFARRFDLRNIAASDAEFRFRMIPESLDPEPLIEAEPFPSAAATRQSSAVDARASDPGRTPTTDAESRALEQGLPPIPGRLISDESPPPRSRRMPPWTISLEVIDSRDWTRIWVDREQLEGDLTVSGRMTMVLRRRSFEMPEFRALLHSGRVASNGSSLLDPVDFDLSLRVHPFSPREAPGRQSLQFFDADLSVDGQVEGLDLFRPLLETVPSLDVSGRGRIEGRALVQGGVLQPPTSITLNSEDFRVGFADLEARGDGSASFAVTSTASGPTKAVFEAKIPRYVIVQKGSESVLMRRDTESDSGIDVTMDLQSPDLSRPLPPVSLELSLARTEVVDASWALQRISANRLLHARGGDGWMTAALAYDTATHSGSGDLRLVVDRLELGPLERRFVGAVDFSGTLDSLDLTTRRASSHQMDLKIQGSSAGNPWRGQLSFPLFCVRFPSQDEGPNAPLAAATTARMTVSDLSPLLDLIGRGKGLKFADAILGVQGLVATGHLSTEGGRWSARNLVFGEEEKNRLEAIADLDLEADQRAGVVFFRWHALSAAATIGVDDTDWKLLRSRRWFDQHRMTLELNDSELASCLEAAASRSLAADSKSGTLGQSVSAGSAVHN